MKILTALLVIAYYILPTNAFALSKTDGHIVIRPMPRSQLVPAQSRVKNYASYQFRLQKGKKSEKMEKKGKYWHLRYLIKDESGKIDRSVSRQEIVQNYREAALEKGGSILYEAGYLLTFSLTRKDGGMTWAYLSANDGSYNLDIIDETAFKKQLTFSAEAMKQALDEKGQVTVYGIYFDLNGATLKLGAEKVLIEIVKLMMNNPELNIQIQGHTDATGSAKHNLDLSIRRAETVKTFLMTYGIKPLRLIPEGYGEKKPVAPNDTEENRALNRRVELVKIN